MTAVQIAMAGALPYSALRDSILTHPTLVEGLFPLFSSSATIPHGPDRELTVAEARAR
jgi:hypothetical protein